jgi:hypothetical protein
MMQTIKETWGIVADAETRASTVQTRLFRRGEVTESGENWGLGSIKSWVVAVERAFELWWTSPLVMLHVERKSYFRDTFKGRKAKGI